MERHAQHIANKTMLNRSSFASLVVATILLIPLSGLSADEAGVNPALRLPEEKRTLNGAKSPPPVGATTLPITQPPKDSTSAPVLLEGVLEVR